MPKKLIYLIQNFAPMTFITEKTTLKNKLQWIAFFAIILIISAAVLINV